MCQILTCNVGNFAHHDLHEHPHSPRSALARRRRRAMGPNRAALEAGAHVAGPGLAHGGAVRRRRTAARLRRTPRAPRGAHAARRPRRRGRIRRRDRAPERRHRPHKREPRRGDRRRGPRAGRAVCGGARPGGGAGERLGGLRARAHGYRARGRGRWRRRDAARRWAGARLGRPVGRVHRGPAAPARGTRRGRGDRGPVRGGCRRRAPGRRVDGRDAGGPGARRPGARARSAGHSRDAAAVLAVRVRTGSGPGRAGGRVRQPRARRRRHRGLARVQRSGSGLADRRRRRGARRDRPEHASGEPKPLRLGSAAG